MIPFKELIKLAKALPKCGIRSSNESGVSYIVDRQGNKVGDIYWKQGEIAIYDEYEYSEQVVEAIGKEKFTDMRKDFELPEEDPILLKDSPEITDRGTMLLQKPRNMEKILVDNYNKAKGNAN